MITERRARCLAQMDEHGIDVLVLGREANVRFASGARRLWTAGTRPFAPGCVVVRSTAAVHVLSTWDSGMPPEVDRAHLFGTTWNPAILTAEVAAIPGVAEARRIGVDGMTARGAALLAAVAPGADVVDGVPAMLAARRRKSADEVAHIREAVAVAAAGIDAAADALRRGVTGRALAGVYLEAMARLGVTSALDEGTFPAGPVAPGDVVLLAGGALYEGYAGVVGRPASSRGLHEPTPDVGSCITLDVIRPGATGADVLARHDRVQGIGLGLEPSIRPDDVLEAGMTLVVRAGLVWETVLVTATGAEPLSPPP